jgi:hypothetical protein
MRALKKTFLVLAIAGIAASAFAFSIGGPFDTWQSVALGYNPEGDLPMGPMNLGDEYRVNVKTITYAFDPSFINYFGQKGIDEINKAIAIMNNLPAMSSLSSNLTEFPQDTQRVNFQASALGLIDLKSVTLGLLVEQLGLASPERWTWALRDRRPIVGTTNFQYLVIKRNFDPGSIEPSSYVNGVLYTYRIQDPTGINGNVFADAIELTVDPLEVGFNAVASAQGGLWAGPLFFSGQFLTGLTRDDVGGLRYLYTGGKKSRYTNLNIENLPLTATLATGSGGAWGPIGGGGGVPAVAVSTAVRPGADKIVFKRAKFDNGGFGFFIGITNVYKDTFMTNSHLVTQKVQIIQAAAPDILFAAADLGVNAGGGPIMLQRNMFFINNAALNSGGPNNAGPGEITFTIGHVITFSKLGPSIVNSGPNAIDEANNNGSPQIWGSYDGTTNAPTVYPVGSSIQELVQRVLSGQ